MFLRRINVWNSTDLKVFRLPDNLNLSRKFLNTSLELKQFFTDSKGFAFLQLCSVLLPLVRNVFALSLLLLRRTCTNVSAQMSDTGCKRPSAEWKPICGA